MSSWAKYLAVSILAATPSLAEAIPIPANSGISLNGYVMAVGGGGAGPVSSATSLDFTVAGGGPSPGVPGVLSSYGDGTGIFTGVSCSTGSCGSIADISNFAIGPQTITPFVQLTGGNNPFPINFALSSIDTIDGGAPFLTFTARGTIAYDGYDPTPAVFFFSTQGNAVTSFSASTLSVAVPEPRALLLLAGALFAAGWSRQRTLSRS